MTPSAQATSLDGQSPTVAVCIATYRRPTGLERLLQGLASQDVTRARLRVVIVDNDGCTDTRAVIDEWRGRFDSLAFAEEPQVGISYARNRALDMAGEVDFVAFIDDDEVPEPDWLDRLLAAQRAYDADVVRGPVVPRFDSPPASWLEQGKFFERPRYATGTELEVAYTHNALVRWPKFSDLRFSPRYARSGGEDAHFFARLRRRGGRIVWADDAVVHEWQPPERQRVSWLVRRQYRIGMMRAVIDSELGLHPRPRLNSTRQAWTRIAGGMGDFVRALPKGKPARVQAVSRMAAGVGRLAGLAGLWFEEYRD